MGKDKFRIARNFFYKINYTGTHPFIKTLQPHQPYIQLEYAYNLSLIL